MPINITKYSKEYQILHKCILVLFFISIFLAPTNFFLVWRPPESYFQGIFIEYWAPKLFATHLSISLLWVVTLLKDFLQNRSSKTTSYKPHFDLFFHLRSHWQLTLAVISLFLSQLLSQHPLLGLLQLTSIFSGPILLFIWMRKEKEGTQRYLSLFVTIAVFFQALLGVLQSILQKNIFGYAFFGEPTLTPSTLGIAYTSLFTERILLPYGTTPHPNILAAWMVLGICVLLFFGSYFIKRTYRSTLIALFTIVLLLTESVSGWLTLACVVIGVFAMKHIRPTIPNSYKVLFLSLAVMTGILWTITPLFLTHYVQSMEANTSVTRRVALIEMALNHMGEQPQAIQGIMGHIPLNLQAQNSTLGWRFLQPVHNIPLILVLDVGICTTLILFYLLIKEYFKCSSKFIIIVAIIPILYLDHFIISTNSGQFFYIIFVYLMIAIDKTNRPR